MKFAVVLRKRFALPALASAAVLLGLGACATPSNRRALYFPQEGLGPWHQFAHRQAVAGDLGVPASSLPRPAAPATVVVVVTKPGASQAPVTPTVPAAGSLDATGGAALPVPVR